MSSRRGVGPTLVVLIACAFSAGIHFALMPSHADESAALGAGFAVAGLLLLAFGLRAKRSGPDSGAPRHLTAAHDRT